jgi:hypothetical protein
MIIASQRRIPHTVSSLIFRRFADIQPLENFHLRMVMAAPSLHHYESLTSHLLWSISIDVLLIMTGSVLLCRLAHVVLDEVRQKIEMQAGSVVMQFVLLIPLLIAVLLVIFQVALIVQAKFVVNYAAFCAVRSAIVVIPTSVRSTASGRAELSNQINLQDLGSPKVEIIRRAAALACAGISPKFTPALAASTNTPPATDSVKSLEMLALLIPANVNRTDVAQEFVFRAPYALANDNTSVTIKIDKHPAGGIGEASYEVVSVRVTYRYYLTVPFADRLFGTHFGSSGWLTNAAFYIPIQEQYSMLSEDDPIFPDSEEPANAQFEVETLQ